MRILQFRLTRKRNKLENTFKKKERLKHTTGVISSSKSPKDAH